ncbi:glutamate receptor ionotropic, kainate glr-3-like [Penaeus vannamei]|uniref:glutamate receptor ionotropic, kainate glr-3-like n=1 Tax=Penaeus vannamei TaxID=6689 RepID=UPI00387FAB35
MQGEEQAGFEGHGGGQASQASELDLTLLLFANASVCESFLGVSPWRWLSGSLLLVSLEDAVGARELLAMTGGVRRSALAVAKPAASGAGSGAASISLVTYLPYNPPRDRFLTKTVDLSGSATAPPDTFLERFSDFHGHHFQVASWIDDFPYLFYNNEKRVVGIGLAMLGEIARRRNFTFHLQEIPPDGFWGELINGTWRGMLGQVVRGEKDFVINGMAVVLDRYRAADFTVPYFSDSYSITLQVPPPIPRWLSVVHPFGAWVWLAVVAGLVLLALVFHALIAGDSAPVYTHKADVLSTFIWLARTLVRQTVPRVPAVPGCRPFLVCWWLAALVLSTSYMGNLIAFLTVPMHTRRIGTLEELARSDIRIHMLDYGNFVPGNLWSSKEPVLKMLGDKLTLLPDYDLTISAFDAGAGVLEATQYSQFLFITRGRSRTSYAVEEKLYPNYQGWVFQKGCPYKHVFDRYLNWMSQAGLVEQWRQVVVEEFRRSQDGGGGGSSSGGSGGTGILQKEPLQALSLDNLQGAFIVLGLGSVLALAALLTEEVVRRCG